MATQTQITHEVPKQTDLLRELRAVMHAYQTNLRLDINHLEAIVGRIAKCTDEEVVKYLPDASESISSLRECLSTLVVHWRIFEIKQEALTTRRST